MPKYFVSYSLQQANFDYSPLFATLERAGAERVLETGWLLSAKQDVRELSSALLRLVGPADSMILTTIGPEAPWAASRISEAGKSWLRNASTACQAEVIAGVLVPCVSDDGDATARPGPTPAQNIPAKTLRASRPRS